MRAKNARALGVWHPPAPGQEDWVHVTVALRPHEYRLLLEIADRYSVDECDVIRIAVLQLLRHAARNPAGFHTSERR